MELKHIAGRTYCCEVGAADVPIWMISDKQWILIDTGTEKSPELSEYLLQNGITVRAIVQTHLHIDHIANNAELVQRFGCQVFAAAEELPDAEFSGQHFDYPIITNLRDEEIVVDGNRFQTVFTPGHTLGHQMIITPDGVCCIGDVMMTLGRLKTAKIPFMRDVTMAIMSLERVRETDYPYYIAAHRGMIPKEILSQTVDANIEIELQLYDLLRKLVTEPIRQSDLEMKFMQAAGLTSKRVMAFRFMHITCEARIQELICAGELKASDGYIFPA